MIYKQYIIYTYKYKFEILARFPKNCRTISKQQETISSFKGFSALLSNMNLTKVKLF